MEERLDYGIPIAAPRRHIDDMEDALRKVLKCCAVISKEAEAACLRADQIIGSYEGHHASPLDYLEMTPPARMAGTITKSAAESTVRPANWRSVLSSFCGRREAA